MPAKTRMPATRDAKTCQACGGTSGQMFACSRCYLANYCSQRCCERDWNKHRDDCKFVTWHRKHVGSNFCHHCFAHACPHATSKLKRCGGCLRVSYCGRECQDNDWRSHAAICTGDKHRKSNETLLREALEEQIAEEEARAKAAEEADKSGSKKKGKKKKSPLDDIPDLYPFDDSPFTKEQRLRIELQTRRQAELYDKLQKKKAQYEAQKNGEYPKDTESWDKKRVQDEAQKNGEYPKDTESWEKKWTQSKRIPNVSSKGQPVSHTIQETHYRIRISNKPPKMHDGYVKNADNTNSYEDEITETREDGSVIIKKRFITNGIIENDKQMDEIARQFGSDFTFLPGVQLGGPESDSDS